MNQQSYASVAGALVTGPGPRPQCDPCASPDRRKIPPRPAARKTTARHPTAGGEGQSQRRSGRENDATRHAKQAAAEARGPGGQARGCPRDPDDAAVTAAPRAFCER